MKNGNKTIITIFILLAAQIATIAFSYGGLNQKVEANTQRIEAQEDCYKDINEKLDDIIYELGKLSGLGK